MEFAQLLIKFCQGSAPFTEFSLFFFKRILFPR
jgi:hypothetical protein